MEILPDIRLFRKINTISYNKKIRNIAFKDVSFLFYDKENKTGYCNVCQKEVQLNNIVCKHNTETICPSCKKAVNLKNLKQGRKNLNYVRWSVKVERVDEQLLIRYFVHTWDLSKDYKNQEIKTTEKIRSIYYGNKKYSDYSYEYEEYTGKYEWTYYKEIKGFMGQAPSEYIRPRSAYLYDSISKIEKVIKDSVCRYSGLPEFLKGYLNGNYMLHPYIIDCYLNTWIKKPYIERFAKVGFINLAYEIMCEYSIFFSIKKEGSLTEMMGITKEHLRWLLEKKDPLSVDIKVLQKYQGISKKDFFTLITFSDYYRNYDAYMECKKYTTLHKIKKYLSLQNKDIRYYKDYLDISEELHYDLKKTFNLFPKNLIERHDERVEERKQKKERLEQEKLDAYNQELVKFMKLNKEALEKESFNEVASSKFLKIGDLFIRLPYTTDEIKQEGEVLHHCVDRYVKKVINKETEIFFIRRASKPEKPFYTLEWKDNEIKQCYGFGNCDATPEVKSFMETFSQLMNRGSLYKAA